MIQLINLIYHLTVVLLEICRLNRCLCDLFAKDAGIFNQVFLSISWVVCQSKAIRSTALYKVFPMVVGCVSHSSILIGLLVSPYDGAQQILMNRPRLNGLFTTSFV